MAALVSTDAARRQLRLTAEDLQNEDLAADVADKSQDATAIVVDYIKRPDHGWTAETTPRPVKTAILLVLTTLFDNRDGDVDPITPAVKSLLARFRDPAYA